MFSDFFQYWCQVSVSCAKQEVKTHRSEDPGWFNRISVLFDHSCESGLWISLFLPVYVGRWATIIQLYRSPLMLVIEGLVNWICAQLRNLVFFNWTSYRQFPFRTCVKMECFQWYPFGNIIESVPLGDCILPCSSKAGWDMIALMTGYPHCRS
jgi:hypothetical protein